MGRDVRMFARPEELQAVREVRELARQLEERLLLLKGAVTGTPGLIRHIADAQSKVEDAAFTLRSVEATVKEDSESPFPCEKCGNPASAWVGDTCEPCSEGDARSDVDSPFSPLRAWVRA